MNDLLPSEVQVVHFLKKVKTVLSGFFVFNTQMMPVRRAIHALHHHHIHCENEG